jgi:putative hydrolase of the HAD superfamily
MPLEAVTFDFHNTLVTCDRWFEVEVYTLVPAVLEWLAARGHVGRSSACPEEGRRRYRDLRATVIREGIEQDALACARHVIAELGLTVDADLLEQAVIAVMRETLDDAAPVDGAQAAVHALAERGVKLAVVSSAVFHPFLEWSLRRFGMLDAFEVVVTSASCGYYKSRPEIYQHAIDALGIDARSAVHVGDSYEYDVLGARRAGMRAVWLSQPRSNGHGDSNLADLTVSSLHGLAPALLARF